MPFFACATSVATSPYTVVYSATGERFELLMGSLGDHHEIIETSMDVWEVIVRPLGDCREIIGISSQDRWFIGTDPGNPAASARVLSPSHRDMWRFGADWEVVGAQVVEPERRKPKRTRTFTRFLLMNLLAAP